MKLSEAERFWGKVAKGDGCWEWQAGLFNTVGPVPVGLFVCHTCDNRKCVRPEHFFIGTAADNNRDMIQKGRSQYPLNPLRRPALGRSEGSQRRDVCKRGHPLVEGNLSVWRNSRKCRTCTRMRNAQYRSAAAAA